MTKARSLSDFIESDGSVTLVDNQKIKLGTSNDFEIYHVANSSNYIDGSTGNIFIRNSSANNDIILQADDGSGGLTNYIQADGSIGEVRLYHYGSEKLNTTSTGIDVTGGISIGGTEVINSSRNLTNITNLVVDNIDLGGNALTVASGDFTVDVAGYITLDTDGGEIQFKDGGTTFGNIAKSNNDMRINQGIQDGDIVFRGNDGGSIITALTLDMSAAGEATFNDSIHVNGPSTITTANNLDTLTLISTDADASVGPVLVFDRTSSSPADNDRVGSIVFQARNDAAEDTDYFTNNVQIKDASNGTEDAAVEFNIMRAGTLTSMMQFDVSETVFNDGSTNTDFRVESSNDTHALFVNGANGRVRSGQVFVASGGTETTLYSSGDGAGLYAHNSYSSCGAHIEIGTDASSGWASQYINRAWSSGEDDRVLQFNINGNAVGYIRGTTSGIQYETTSDIRLKTDIEPIKDSTEKLMSMNPVEHKWKADQDADSVHGFIAQEMQEIIPEAVSGDPESEEMMSMDYGRITPIIVGALQDAHNKIIELENKLKELGDK